MMRVEDPDRDDRVGRTSADTSVYSVVRVAEVAYGGDDLTPIPGYVVQGGPPPAGVDPEGVIGGDREGFLIGVHAADPPVGPGGASLGSLIGLAGRPAGAFRDVPVPIVANLTELRNGQTMPPHPEGPGATLVAKVWRFAPVDGVPVPRPVTVEGDALQARAEMDGGLNRNSEMPTFVLSVTGVAPEK